MTDAAMAILKARYLRDGETPKEMFRRVAEAVAKALPEHKRSGLVGQWATIMERGWFLPNSPTLMNAGGEIGQLAACFVLPVDDSLSGIFDAVKSAALVHQSGGGTGFDFSKLRPEGDMVRSTRGVASGPVAFMQTFNVATEAIKQGSKRRGANMGVLRVDHPDIERFIKCKAEDGVLSNFNISVGLTDEFMEAATSWGSYELVNPRTGKAVKTCDAALVLEWIVRGAWRNGEPGVLFLDAIERGNPTPHLGRLEATNPCGEQPLLPYEACNLGSVNLGAMYMDDASAVPPSVDGDSTILEHINWVRLSRVVRLAVQFLDCCIDVGRYPLGQIAEAVRRTRKIGLGFMGLADLLIRLRVPYDSEEGVMVAGAVAEFIRQEAVEQSRLLAEELGPYPAFTGDGVPQRNATLTTVAPTGTISMVADASSGCEPLFGVAFEKRGVLGGDTLVQVNAPFVEMAKQYGFYSEELMRKIAVNGGSVQGLDEVPLSAQRLLRTALEIDWGWHVRMQSTIQAHVDNAVSKTINLPNDAPVEDVRSAIVGAWMQGCKGLTLYRSGSRETEVITVGPRPAPTATQVPAARPDVLEGSTRRLSTPCGTLWVTVNTHEGQPFEVFCQIGRAGSDVGAFTEAVARLISLALRCGVPLDEIVNQLRGIGGSGQVGFGPNAVRSVPAAIAQALESVGGVTPEPDTRDLCPECGAYSLVRESGCKHCESCGYSAC